MPLVPPVFNAGISRWGYHLKEFQFSSTGRDLNYPINKLIKSATDKEIFSFVDIDSSNYFSTIPSGYYFSTPSALKQLHYVTSDFKAITFEPLGVKYNRPNKVLEAIDSTDTALIRSYRKAYERRTKKSVLIQPHSEVATVFLKPILQIGMILNLNKRMGRSKLDIKNGDNTYKNDRFFIWINETPVNGQRGISLRNKNTNSLETTINIDFSRGENKIETSITNLDSTESYRMPLLVNYTPANKQIEKHISSVLILINLATANTI